MVATILENTEERSLFMKGSIFTARMMMDMSMAMPMHLSVPASEKIAL